MERHAFNPVSFIFGIAFVAAAAAHFVSDAFDRTIEGRWVWPIALVLAGLALLATAVGRMRRPGNGEPSPQDLPASSNQP